MNHKVWFASDFLFGAEGLNRPKGWEDKFLKAWNDVVGSKDIVCILGNVAVNSVAEWFWKVSKLPGNKLFIMGDKDRNRINWYKKFGFIDVVPFGHSRVLRSTYGNILLSHIPAAESVSVSYSGKFLGLSRKHARELEGSSSLINIHGNSLGIGSERHNTFDVSLEAINYCPILLDQVYDLKFRHAA